MLDCGDVAASRTLRAVQVLATIFRDSHDFQHEHGDRVCNMLGQSHVPWREFIALTGRMPVCRAFVRGESSS
jgi:hypothetical protein